MNTKAVTESIALLQRLRIVNNNEEYKNFSASLAKEQEKVVVVSWLNAHALTLAQSNSLLRSNLLDSTFVFRDGIGISVLLKLLGINGGYNMNGTDFIPEVLRSYSGKTIALLGTEEPFLSKAAQSIEAIGGKVVLCLDGFQESIFYAQELERVDASLVVLAMGMPKQENVAIYLAKHLKKPCLILNGGAILDFIAERFPRAPKLWRTCKLEWLYRLIQEPRRLWKRYILGGFLFLVYSLQIIYTMRIKSKISL